MAKESTTQNVVRVAAKFTVPVGKGLAGMAALDEKMTEAWAAFALAVGITPADIEVDARPVRALKETTAAA